MKALFLTVLLSRSCLLMAQMTPQFLMPIWFKDAVGNTDTVWVGGDPGASSSNTNTQFGEVELTEPFDSTFEVRLVHGDYNWLFKQYKKVVEHNDSPGSCYLGAGTNIFIHAKYWPVTISWDTTYLVDNYPCNINMVLTPDFRTFVFQNWYEARVIYCMMTRTSVTEDFGYETEIEDMWLHHDFEIEGQGQKTLHGLYFAGFWDAPYCYTTLDSHEEPPNASMGLMPNPANEEVEVQSGNQSIKAIQVLDFMGKTKKSVKLDGQTAAKLSTQAWLPGLYFLKITTAGNREFVQKLVVSH